MTSRTLRHTGHRPVNSNSNCWSLRRLRRHCVCLNLLPKLKVAYAITWSNPRHLRPPPVLSHCPVTAPRTNFRPNHPTDGEPNKPPNHARNRPLNRAYQRMAFHLYHQSRGEAPCITTCVSSTPPASSTTLSTSSFKLEVQVGDPVCESARCQLAAVASRVWGYGAGPIEWLGARRLARRSQCGTPPAPPLGVSIHSLRFGSGSVFAAPTCSKRAELPNVLTGMRRKTMVAHTDQLGCRVWPPHSRARQKPGRPSRWLRASFHGNLAVPVGSLRVGGVGVRACSSP